MNLHWIGFFPFTGFFLLMVFTLGTLYAAYRAVKMINRPYHQATNQNILIPIFSLIAYALLCILFKQAISSGIISFDDPDTPLIIDIVLGVIQLLAGLFVLSKILKSTMLKAL